MRCLMKVAIASSMVAWGRDLSGQCSNAPTDPGFKQVTAGGSHSLALKSDGSLLWHGDEI